MELWSLGFGDCPFGEYPFGDGLPWAGAGGFMVGEQWNLCQRCGRPRPLSLLRIQPGDHGGMEVCIVTCFDAPSRNDMWPDELPREGPLMFVDDGGPNQ